MLIKIKHKVYLPPIMTITILDSYGLGNPFKTHPYQALGVMFQNLEDYKEIIKYKVKKLQVNIDSMVNQYNFLSLSES